MARQENDLNDQFIPVNITFRKYFLLIFCIFKSTWNENIFKFDKQRNLSKRS